MSLQDETNELVGAVRDLRRETVELLKKIREDLGCLAAILIVLIAVTYFSCVVGR